MDGIRLVTDDDLEVPSAEGDTGSEKSIPSGEMNTEMPEGSEEAGPAPEPVLEEENLKEEEESPAESPAAEETPEAEASEAEAPETEAPETEAPETEAPETETPEAAAPETATPEAEQASEAEQEDLFPAKKDFSIDELPEIEDVLGLNEPEEEQSAQEKSDQEEPAREKPASSGFHIPFLGGKKKDKDEPETADAKEADKADAEKADAEKAETGTAEEKQDSEAEEEKDKKSSLLMPSGSVRSILIAGVVILIIILAYAWFQSRRVYSSYEVMSEVTSAGDASASYKVSKNGMIRYSNNGIALTDKSGNVIWNQTYEMNNPIIDTAGNYIAAGDRGASTLFIFNQFGQCGKLTTELPIQGLQLADNGVTAVILSDAESNFINLYDRQGNRLVGIRATLENTGYPLAVGVSPDATHLVVSYLTISEDAKIQTKLVFYDFSMSTGEHEKHSGVINGLCPRIQFLGDQRVAVFRESGFDIYSIDSEIKMVFSSEFEDEIRSIFADDQRLGFIFRNKDGNGKYRIELYDVSGQKTMTIYSDLDYTDLRADDDEVALFNSSRAEIYKFNGRQVFGGDFENRITALMPSWDTGMYWLVEESQLSEIRVK